jgi:hypothetical protein
MILTFFRRRSVSLDEHRNSHNNGRDSDGSDISDVYSSSGDDVGYIKKSRGPGKSTNSSKANTERVSETKLF